MQALGNTLSQVRGRPVDVVLFLNRLDEFRVDASDIQVRAEACSLKLPLLYVLHAVLFMLQGERMCSPAISHYSWRHTGFYWTLP